MVLFRGGECVLTGDFCFLLAVHCVGTNGRHQDLVRVGNISKSNCMSTSMGGRSFSSKNFLIYSLDKTLLVLLAVILLVVVALASVNCSRSRRRLGDNHIMRWGIDRILIPADCGCACGGTGW